MKKTSIGRPGFGNHGRVALVLGGGAARGFAHVGVLEVLEAEGIPIDMIVGTSVGAIFGSLYAAGLEVKTIRDLAFRFKTRDILDIAPLGRLGLIDLKGLRWHPMPVVYKIFGVSREKLPALVRPTDIAGTVSEEGARSFGVPQGLPVIIGAGDKQSELLGAGAISSDIAEISYGTAAVVEVLSDKYVTHPNMDFFTWGAAIPNQWALEGFLPKGYWMVSWFKEQFCKQEEEEASRLKLAPEDLLNREMDQVPPGAMGLMLQPHWHPLENDPLSKGAIIGFAGHHTRPHVYRAIVEGVAYELRRMMEMIERRSGYSIRELRVGGGGSKSDEVMQITADIFGLPTRRLHTSNLSALGAAIDAAVALGVYDSFTEAVSNMVRLERTFTPRKENARIYDRLFNEVYKKVYPTLCPLHYKIAEITGYPKVKR